MSLRVVVLSDTHLRAGSRRQLPEAAYRLLDEAEVILHAGDVVDSSLLDTLSAIATTHAVLGNNDVTLAGRLPVIAEIDIEGVRIAMIHDSGPKTGRAARMRRRFPDADIVVFGHSHIPVDADGLDGQRLFNPGSPTERRAQPHRSAGILDLSEGAIRSHRIVIVD